MEKVLIIGCKKVMDEACIACSRCLVGFNRRQGAFSAYDRDDSELVGMMHCGDCPGAACVHRMTQLALWNAPLGEQPTRIHVANCILDHCPYRGKLVRKIRERSAVPVVEGAHPFQPGKLFG